MTQPEIRTALAQLATEAHLHEGDLPEGDLAEHLDSVQRLTLVVAIEDHFKVCFEPEDEATLVTLDDLVRAIQQKLQASQ
jgi:acyl carrier protein